MRYLNRKSKLKYEAVQIPAILIVWELAIIGDGVDSFWKWLLFLVAVSTLAVSNYFEGYDECKARVDREKH